MAASLHERIKWQREVWLKEFHAPARIPQDIVLDVSMGAVERWTYVYLLCLETKSLTDSYSVTTVAHLAKKWRVTRAEMRGYLRNLEKAGWMHEIDRTPGRRGRFDVRKYELLRHRPDFGQ